jgi:hypothetical protein
VKPSVLIDLDVRSESNPLDLGGDAISGDAVAGKFRDNI